MRCRQAQGRRAAGDRPGRGEKRVLVIGSASLWSALPYALRGTPLRVWIDTWSLYICSVSASGSPEPRRVIAPSEKAVASRAQSGRLNPFTWPAISPATIASPAPTVLFTFTTGGTASSVVEKYGGSG